MRRAVAVAAVVAAACGPLLVAQVDIRPDTAFPADLAVVLGLVPATFVVLAAFAAATARRRPIRPALAARLAAAPVAVTAAAGLATTTAGIDQGVILLIGAAGAGPFAVGAAALALARQGRHAPARRTTLPVPDRPPGYAERSAGTVERPAALVARRVGRSAVLNMI